jgi:K+-sensing histidine kinase KdpD
VNADLRTSSAVKRAKIFLRHPTVTIYVIAFLSVTAAILVTQFLNLIFGFTPLIVFVAAITFSTIWGGGKAGLLSLLLTVLAINFFFIPPLHALTLATDDAVRLVLFGLAIGIGLLLRHQREWRQ